MTQVIKLIFVLNVKLVMLKETGHVMLLVILDAKLVQIQNVLLAKK